MNRIYRFRGGVNGWGSRIRQNESWYKFGPFQTTKVELFTKIAFGYKPSTLFCESLQLVDWFHKTLPINTYVLLVKILHHEKST